MSKPYPKVKAMGLFVSNGRILATQFHDSVKGEDFLRLIGGHVEFGELSEAAFRREVEEELGAQVENVRLLEVVENVFVYEGRPGHEVIFVYHAEFLDRSLYAREIINVSEGGLEYPSVWTPVQDVYEGKVRLYPTVDYARLVKLAEDQKP
jgi:8-oxo-dGTP pyrophosphatase MutT (NUDIX family)